MKEKCGRYTLFREPLYLDRCITCTETDWEDYFEVQEILSKDTFIFKVITLYKIRLKLYYRNKYLHKFNSSIHEQTIECYVNIDYYLFCFRQRTEIALNHGTHNYNIIHRVWVLGERDEMR